MRRAPSPPHRPRGLPGLFLLFLLSFLQPAVAEANWSAVWDSFWPEYVTVGPEGVKVFVGYLHPSEPVGKCDTSPERMVPWNDSSRSLRYPILITLGVTASDPSTPTGVLELADGEAALLPLAAACFRTNPTQTDVSQFSGERAEFRLRWLPGQQRPASIDVVKPFRRPVPAGQMAAMLDCLSTAMVSEPSLAGPARERTMRLRYLSPLRSNCLGGPPEGGPSELIALRPQFNPPRRSKESKAPRRSKSWLERHACLEAELLRVASPPAGTVTQTFIPVERNTSISPAFGPGVEQAKQEVGQCLKSVGLPEGVAELEVSWPVGSGGRLGAGKIVSNQVVPPAALPCLRRAIARVSLPPVPDGFPKFRLAFRVYTRSVEAPPPSCSPPGWAAELSGTPAEWAAELFDSPPRDSLLFVLPYALIATPLPVLPVEPPLPPPPPPPLFFLPPPPPPPPAVTTRVGSGRPPPESFGFMPPARAELDAMQRCLDSCVANNRWSEIGSKALSSAVVEVYPWCDEPPELGTIDCVPPSLAELGPSCAKQCLRRANVAGSLFLGAHPDDFVQPEPPPLLALVFDGSKGDPRGLAKLAVAAQPAVQRCFLDAAEEEAVPDWVNLRIKYEVDGRVASVTGWEGRGSDELIGCLARVAAKWDTLKPLRVYAESARSLMLVLLRRDPRAVRIAGWELGVRRGIRFESLDPLEPSTSARLLAGFKRYTFGLVGLEEHSSAILKASLALLPAYLLLRAFRRRRRADSQSD